MIMQKTKMEARSCPSKNSLECHNLLRLGANKASLRNFTPLQSNGNEKILDTADSIKLCEKDNLLTKNSKGILTQKYKSGISLAVKPSKLKSISFAKEPLQEIRQSPNASKVSQKCSANNSNIPLKLTPIEKENMQMQFKLKKRKLDKLKFELAEKLNNCSDMYQTLVNLKQKLNESGDSNVTLEHFIFDEIKFGETSTKYLAKNIESMEALMKNILSSLIKFCQGLVDKSLAVTDSIKSISIKNLKKQGISEFIEDLRNENSIIEILIEDTFRIEEKHFDQITQRWQELLLYTGDSYITAEQIDHLQNKLKIQEKKLEFATKELQTTLICSDRHERKCLHNINLANELHEKIKYLENELEKEKSLTQTETDNIIECNAKIKKNNDLLQSLEKQQQGTEANYVILLNIVKRTEEQQKLRECEWAKERNELIQEGMQVQQSVKKFINTPFLLKTRTLLGFILRCFHDLVHFI